VPELGGISVMDVLGLVDEQQVTAYLAPADGEDTAAPGGDMTAKAFQYWPSEVSISKEPGWQFRDVPGSSHPLAYWTQSGATTVSFTAVFTTDVKHDFTPLDVINGNVPEAMFLDPKRNQDLRAVRKWLDWYTTPLYKDDGFSRPPPKLLLVMPGLQLARNGADDILCVMTQCDVSFQDFFPNGAPRRMEAQLSFVEIVQSEGKVIWQGRDTEIVGDAWGPLDYAADPVKKFSI
jgi:hypothetical protein